jgi:signal transduction histidine kinase
MTPSERGDLSRALKHGGLQAEVLRLRARVEELEREREELETFSAMAAHEMLKPLVMTEGFATLLGERVGHSLDMKSRSDLEAIVHISSRARRLVEALMLDVRDSTRPLRQQQVDLSQILRNCAVVLESEIEAHSARLDIAPMPVVKGDEALLSGVFNNLLSNALKYGPRHGNDIRISAMRTDAGWTIGIDSSGPPIPTAGRQRLFEPWQRGPGERRASGFGLGLAIVRHIVERHGGKVSFISAHGGRNRFDVTLPV